MKKWLSDAVSDGLHLLKILAVISVPVAMLMFHVWNQYRITELGYEVAEQTDEHRELLEEQRKLRIEATFQGHGDRATTVAREEFDLEPVRPEQVIHIDPQADDGALDEQAALQLSSN